jgi:hypothetical protein
MRIPNLIIPGAQKSATSTLARLLEAHNEIYLGEQKEPHFFSKDRKYTQGLSYYRDYYTKHQNQKIIIDASQCYMPLKFVPERIFKTLGENIRFIFVLRNPVDRAVSAFSHFRTRKRGEIARNLHDIVPDNLQNLTLDELISYEKAEVRECLKTGLTKSRNDTWSIHGFPFNYFYVSSYSIHITNYFNYYPKSQFLFLTFEEVTKFQKKVIAKVADFLNEVNLSGFNIDKDIYANPTLKYKWDAFELLSRTQSILNPVIPEAFQNRLGDFGRRWFKEKPNYQFPNETRDQLNRLFHEEICRVETLTSLNLESWKVGKISHGKS